MVTKFVAVIERWLFNKGAIISQVTLVGGCNSEVAALQNDHYTEVSLHGAPGF